MDDLAFRLRNSRDHNHVLMNEMAELRREIDRLTQALTDISTSNLPTIDLNQLAETALQEYEKGGCQ